MLFCQICVGYTTDTPLYVVTNYAYMYHDANFSSEKFDFKIEQDEQVVLLDENLINDFYNVSYLHENVVYEGYVYKECISSLTKEQDVVLTYNAKTAIDTIVYTIDSTEENLVKKFDTPISADTELYLFEGFDRKSKFTKVKFSYNGEIVLGQIRTEDISPYGISNVLIISLTAIIACVGVIFILLGISKKKTKIPFVNLGKQEK